MEEGSADYVAMRRVLIFCLAAAAASAAGPSVVTQPGNIEVPAGCPATLLVTATGDAPLAYQWWLGGEAVAAGTVSRYTFTTTEITGEPAEYYVVITNASGSVTSAVATISVVEAADCPAMAVPKVRIGGRNVSLMVKAERFLPLALTRSVLTMVSTITNDTLAAASRRAVYPSDYLGWGRSNCGQTNNMPYELITNAVWSNTFVFKGCDGIGSCVQGWYSNADVCVDSQLMNRGVLVTRRHFLTQGHICTPAAGVLGRFIGTNNEVHLAKIKQTVCGNWALGVHPWADNIKTNTNGTDTFAMAQFEEDVPGDVQIVKAWPTNAWRYLATDDFNILSPGVDTCQHNYYVVTAGTTVARVNLVGLNPSRGISTWDGSNLPTLLKACEFGAIVGDSGSPSYSVLDNQLIGGVRSLYRWRVLVEATIMYLWTNNGGAEAECPTLTDVDLSAYAKLR